MRILDIIERQSRPLPWSEGEKIPWNDPAFSERMLNEHLTQAHDMASRRSETIDRHVTWIHQHILAASPAKILDLGCGPGLYTNRLARLGHQCLGIDFSPASIAYARAQSEKDEAPCRYIEQDVRSADYGVEHTLAMFIFGEFSTFQPDDARTILRKCCQALVPGGTLLLEPHTYERIQQMGQEPATWYTSKEGLFLDRPYLLLRESDWNAVQHVTTWRYFIIEAETGAVVHHAISLQAYSRAEFEHLLNECGFEQVEFYLSLQGDIDESQQDFMAVVARKKV